MVAMDKVASPFSPFVGPIESITESDDEVRAAVELVAGSPAIEFAQGEAEAFARRAKAALDPLPAGQARSPLEALADYSVRRRF